MAKFKYAILGALFVVVAVLVSGPVQAQLITTTATSNLTVSAEADLDDFWVVKVETKLQNADDGYWSLPTIKGWLWGLVTNPSSPAPTDNYDIYILDDQGSDILNGAGVNRDTAMSERYAPVHMNGSTVAASTAVQWVPVYMNGPMYLSIVGNTQDGALVDTFMWIKKKVP